MKLLDQLTPEQYDYLKDNKGPELTKLLDWYETELSNGMLSFHLQLKPQPENTDVFEWVEAISKEMNEINHLIATGQTRDITDELDDEVFFNKRRISLDTTIE